MFAYFESLIKPFNELASPTSKSAFTLILRHTQGIKRYIFIVAALSTVIAATEVYIFKFLGDLVDLMGAKTADRFFEENFSDLLWMGFILLGVLPLSVFLRTLFEHQSLELNFPVRSLYNLHNFILGKGIEFFQNHPAGKISNSLMQSSFSIKLVIVKLVNTFTFIGVFFLSMSILLTGIDPILMLPALAWVAGYIFIVSYFFPKIKAHQEKQARESPEMMGNIVDTYSNILTVKIFSRNKQEMKFASNYMSKFLGVASKHMRVFSQVQLVMWGMNVLLVFGTLSLSIWLWGLSAISVGAIAAAVSVSFRLYTMSHWIMWELLDVSRNMGVVQFGAKLLQESKLDDTPTASKHYRALEEKDILFGSVDYAYSPERRVLSSFNLVIKKGEKVGIVGPSGCGKSTLVKLLLGLVKPDRGEIKLGKTPINNLSQEVLLSSISVVTQDVQMLNRSIQENLTYGSESVSEEKIVALADAVGLTDCIESFVDNVGNQSYSASAGVGGGKLSGGQKQRISIVRALLKESDIYVFDEATSALDKNTEKDVMDTIRSYLKDKTVIIITHKEENISWVDKVIRMENGHVKQSTRIETLEACPNEGSLA